MKVFLHIGYFKTGTTALQRFLEENRAPLHALGVCYPSAGRPCNNWGHSVLSNGLLESVGESVPAWYLLGQQRRPRRYIVEEQWERTLKELRSSGCKTGIISSEAFIRFGATKQADSLISSIRRRLLDFDVEILCYVRRPDKYLSSWYNQLVSAGDQVKQLRYDIERLSTTIHVDYKKALDPWISAFGAGSVRLREYDQIIRDSSNTILDVINIVTGGHKLKSPDESALSANESLPRSLIELKRLHNHLTPSLAESRHANRAIRFLKEHIALPADESVELLSAQCRATLYTSFAKTHTFLNQLNPEIRFFEDIDAMLHGPRTVSMTDSDAALTYSGLFALTLSKLQKRVSA